MKNEEIKNFINALVFCIEKVFDERMKNFEDEKNELEKKLKEISEILNKRS